MIKCFFLNFEPLTKAAPNFYHRNGYLLGGVAVKPLFRKMTSLRQASGINCNNTKLNVTLSSLINIACF